MKYRALGKTKLQVSEMGFGCWALGGTAYGPVRDEESLDALETAWERGINFFDTADIYGHGHSEKVLAQFLKGKPRAKVILATKVGHDFYHGGVKKDFTAEYIREACYKSLARLELETLDVYQLHNPSLEIIKKGEAVGALEELKKEGKIRFIGVSIYSEEEALACLEDPRVETLQVILNLIDQRMARGVLDTARTKEVGVIAREPLACGLLTGKYDLDHQFPKDDHRRGWMRQKRELDLKKIEKLKTIFPSERISFVRAALEFVLDFEEIATVIPGAKTRAQVLENLLAVEDPRLRAQESSHLRDFYRREKIFKEGLD